MRRSARIRLIYGAVSLLVAAILICTVLYRRAYVWASWYGPHFHGERTANGEIFDMYKMTAAHRIFSFGTVIEVTNCDTDRKVCVRINDRGPYKMNSIGKPLFPLQPHPYRELDLSYAAARKLGMVRKGVARVIIEVVSRQPIREKERKI